MIKERIKIYLHNGGFLLLLLESLLTPCEKTQAILLEDDKELTERSPTHPSQGLNLSVSSDDIMRKQVVTSPAQVAGPQNHE